jgi:hypothetical protein
MKSKSIQYDLSENLKNLKRKSSLVVGASFKENYGLESLKLVHYCILNDIKAFSSLISIEKEYCRKVEHALHLTNFISSVKPFVCLNFDPFIGFTLVRQDKCDKH